MDNIILLFGGDSCERDISTITALQVYENIDKNKYNVIPIYLYEGEFYHVVNMNIDVFINDEFKKMKRVYFRNRALYYKHSICKSKFATIECVLLAMHGGNGENGELQGYLDINDIAYTSTGVMASSCMMDKCVTKLILHGLDIPYVDYIMVRNSHDIDYEKIVNSLGFPLIVKPANLGSSIGVVKVSNLESLKDAVELAFYYDNKILIEKALEDFREFNIALFRDEKLILSDIEEPLNKSDILNFADKYLANGKLNAGYRDFPAKINDELKANIEEYATRIYDALDMKGVIRIDFLEKDGNLYLNEVNTIPGSLAFYLFENKGLTASYIIDSMIANAKLLHEKKKKLINYYSSSVLKSAKYAVNKLRK